MIVSRRWTPLKNVLCQRNSQLFITQSSSSKFLKWMKRRFDNVGSRSTFVESGRQNKWFRVFKHRMTTEDFLLSNRSTRRGHQGSSIMLPSSGATPSILTRPFFIIFHSKHNANSPLTSFKDNSNASAICTSCIVSKVDIDVDLPAAFCFSNS